MLEQEKTEQKGCIWVGEGNVRNGTYDEVRSWADSTYNSDNTRDYTIFSISVYNIATAVYSEASTDAHIVD